MLGIVEADWFLDNWILVVICKVFEIPIDGVLENVIVGLNVVKEI